ncbi:hypothetical protein [Nitrobacter sp.]|uniref:hypothetical protein n=1 Tax=Nitrobacter sp. TaxID=29420 RepID=UPI003F65464C
MMRTLLWKLRWQARRISDPFMSRCRVCGGRENVVSFDPRGLWAYPTRRTWCPDHCPGHDYVYSRWDGHYCNNCGDLPDLQWYDDRAQDAAEFEAEAAR